MLYYKIIYFKSHEFEKPNPIISLENTKLKVIRVTYEYKVYSMKYYVFKIFKPMLEQHVPQSFCTTIL